MPRQPIATDLRIVRRQIDSQVERECLQSGLTPLQARIVAARIGRLDAPPERILQPRLADLHDPALLADCERASARLARAVKRGERIGILTDYDVDGITSHALIHLALTEYFKVTPERVSHHIGHRLQDGYGVSAPLAERILAAAEPPDVIVTADCGSSDQQRLALLAEAGIDVIVTDHHEIPAEGIPEAAYAVVNPTRDDCAFPDRTIAGCMVSWLLMCESRRRLLESGWLEESAPNLAGLLDFVALGTVADAVSLFGAGNRAVVLRGLKTMNRLERPCWRALARLLGRQHFEVQDLGFQIGPRINARGRMADPLAALRFLLAADEHEADRQLLRLDQDNQDRRAAEQRMLVLAREAARDQIAAGARMLVVFDEQFHAGVQGIVASRLVDGFGFPAVVLSPGSAEGSISGSARSIPGLDIRAVLQSVAEQAPGLLQKFGGHTGAAGLTLGLDELDRLRELLNDRVAAEVSPSQLGPVLLTDGELGTEELAIETVAALDSLAPYGREFEAPLFEGRFEVLQARRIGSDGTHVSLSLGSKQGPLRAVWFRAVEHAAEQLPVARGDRLRFAYRLQRDDYRGGDSVQLIVAGAEVRARALVDA